MLEPKQILNEAEELMESAVMYLDDALARIRAGKASGRILDPVKVTRSALQNATSVASTLLTTESAVANIKEDLPPMPAGGGMGMM